MYCTLLLAACTATLAEAAVTCWPTHYLGGVAPDILNQKLAAKARELGFDSFALDTKDPIIYCDICNAAAIRAAADSGVHSCLADCSKNKRAHATADDTGVLMAKDMSNSGCKI